MKQTTSRSKKTPARRTVARNAGIARRSPEGSANAQAALSVLMALLHADRWVFEAGEVAKRAGMRTTAKDFHAIRLSIVHSLNKVQPLAYGPRSSTERPGTAAKHTRAPRVFTD